MLNIRQDGRSEGKEVALSFAREASEHRRGVRSASERGIFMKLTPDIEGKLKTRADTSERKLIKIKRSSGEFQYVTKEEYRRLNKEKAKRRYDEKDAMKKKWQKAIIAFCLVIAFAGSYFAFLRIKDSYNKRALVTLNTAHSADKYDVGRILVTTNVNDVIVLIDGSPVEQTYNKESNIRDYPAGEYTLTVEKPGYIAHPPSQKVTVMANETVYAHFTLRREQSEKTDPTPFKEPEGTKISEPKPREKTITVLPSTSTDVTPPVVDINTGPFATIKDNIGIINDNSISFVLKASEPAEFSCYLEGYDSGYGEFSANNTKQYRGLLDGSYTFYVKARDKSGNETPEPLVNRFIVDTTAPGVNIVEGPNGTISHRNITFNFSASESASFSFHLDGYEHGYSGYSKTNSVNYSNLPNGKYTLYVKAKDDVGNEDAEPAERSFVVDTTAPGAFILKGPKGLILQGKVTIAFTARKKSSTFAHYLKGREIGFSDYKSEATVSYDNLPDGTYTFYVKAKDDIGNVDPEPASLSFTVDTTPPKTTITAGPAGDIDYDDVTFNFTASDKATFSYYLEGYDKGFSGYTSETSKTYNNLPDGGYTFHVKSTDAAGNVEKDSAERNFTVKTMVLILKEDFEKSKTIIKAGDFLKSGGADYWGRAQKRTKHGKFSLWCAGMGGQSGTYDKNMNAWYELQVDLSHYSKANLSFWYYLDTTNDIADQFALRIAPRNKVKIKDYTGFRSLWKAPLNKNKSPAWIKQTINLNSFCSKPVVIRFSFDSDDKIEDEGAYIDSIVIMGKY